MVSVQRRPVFFLRLFLPLTLLVLVGVALYGRSEIERELTRLRSQEQLAVGLGSGALTGNLEGVSRDLGFLASQFAMRLAVDKPTPENLARLGEDWTNFSRHQRVYDKLRWLDEGGMEVVRVDYANGQPYVVPADKLQRKSERYFFSDAFKLDAGQVYISPLDLNVEQNQVELPPKPTLRVAAPIFNTAGKKRGIVILNYYGSAMLQAFANATHIADHLMVLNADGYWLKSPNPADEWGFMFNRPELTLGNRAAPAWARIRGEDRGQMTLADGLWTWQTVYPLRLGQISSTGAGEVFASSRAQVDSRQYVWKSVAHLPASALAAVMQAVGFKLAGVALALLGVLGLGSWKLTQAWARQALAEEELRRINTRLEQTVAERTQTLLSVNEDLGQREALLRQVLDTSSVAIFLVDLQGRITRANQRMAEMFGCSVAALEGSEYVSLVHPSERELGREKMLALLASDVASVDLDRLYWRADQTRFWGHLSGKRFHDAAGTERGLLGVIADIDARKQAEQFERFRSRILELLAGDAALAHILQTLVLGVEELNPAQLCTLLLLDDEGRRLHVGAAPSLPDFFTAAIDGVEIGIGKGSGGTAAFTGERVVVADIATHPYWAAYKELAQRAGLGSCWAQPIRSSAGQVLGTFAIYHRQVHTPTPADIHLIEQCAHLASIAIERKRVEQQLHLAASVFSHASEGIMITDVRGTIIDVNEAFSRITGHGREQVLGRNPRILKSGVQRPEFYAAMWRALIGHGQWTGEVWNRRQNGELYVQLQTISAVRDAAGNTLHYVALFSDITTLKAQQQHLEHIAHFDVLTDLPNRVLLADRLHQAMVQAQRRGQRLAVAYLDLDGFKLINDKHGHEVGDQLLISVAKRMKLALREGDTLARLGGDEFVAVLPDLSDVSVSLPVLTRLLTAAAEPVTLGQVTLEVSASLGVTFYPQSQDIDADQLLRQADQAMYQAKLAGKNRVHFFDAEQDNSIRGHHEGLERLRQALNEGEFVLYYQPKVNMRTGSVVGAEALIRWQHPQQGLLAPASFLPLIEDHPLAIEVGEWVMNAALAQRQDWQAAGLDLPVSVNVGAYQLQQTNFVERLRAILAGHPHAKPGDLELEVLETSALDDLTHVSAVIEACRRFGVTFALDDFGTGYSSLTYLKRLAVTALKVDRSFVRGMLDDPDDLAILEGVMGLARAFGRQVIAEGVETLAHGTLLLQLGCELAQGYGIAHPMPAADFRAWAAAWRPAPVWAGLLPVSRDDLPALLAGVEHHAWVAEVEAFLKDGRAAPPPLDHRQCHFGQWLTGAGLARYGTRPAFATTEALHRRVHVLAAQLVALRSRGQGSQAQARLSELHALRNAVLEQTPRLLQGTGF